MLKSWAVPRGPSLDRNEKRLAVETEDHPYDYGSFEGVIPAGQYGAGEVIVWDCGVYSPDEGGSTWFHDRAQAEREVREGLAKGKLSVLLRGEKLKGSFALVRTKEAKQWLLIKHKDRFVADADVTARDRSVLSGMKVGELKFLPPVRAHARGAARARRARSSRCPRRCRRCSPRSATRRSTAPTGCGSRSSTAIACSPSSTSDGVQAALAARARAVARSFRASWPSSPSSRWTA